MVAGDLIYKTRFLYGEPDTTRFSDADVLSCVNDAQNQLAYEIDFPEDLYDVITIPVQVEYQIINCIKILQVYVMVGYNPSTGTYASKQPIYPTDKPTLMGQNLDLWDQSSNIVQGSPTYTPQWLAQGPVAYPVTGGGLGVVPMNIQAPWQNTAMGGQRPEYYMRGGFFGLVPAPVTTYYIRIECIPAPPAMTTSATLCTFPDGCKDAIAYKACEYMAMGDKVSLVNDFDTRYMRELPKLRNWRDRLQGGKSRLLTPLAKRTFFRCGGWIK
jgi:hypothetical protein